MQKSSFFNAELVGETWDRTYTAEDYADYFGSFIGNGVFPNPSTNLQIVVNGDMTITVKEGKSWINGYMYHNDSDLILNVDPADGVLKRIDRVVVRLDFINREITCKVKKGTFASSPVAPSLQRDSDVHELGIADILIDNGVISIVQSKITDTRLNTNLCGIVTQTVNEINTTELYNKLQSYIDEIGLNVQAWSDAATAQWSIDFNTWFDTVKNILNSDVAGNLANRIAILEDKVGNGLTADNITMANGSTVEASITGINQSISSSTSSESITNIANSYAVKQAMDMANSAFQSASNGKTLIANAITGIGLLADDSEDFASLSNKIAGIGGVRPYIPGWYSNIWVTSGATSLTKSRGHLTASAVKDKIYAIGGDNGGLTTVECYDTSTNAVTTKAAMPTGRTGLVSETVGTNIYCIGGSTNYDIYVDQVNVNECYDSLTDTWSTKAPMPHSRNCLASSQINGKIYCIGGYDGTTFHKTNECYDTISNTWSTKAAMPTNRAYLGASIIGNKIYCVGGVATTYNGRASTTHECYDVVTNTWSTKASPATPYARFGCNAVDNKMYCTYSTDIAGSHECYDPATNTWSTKAAKFGSRCSLGSTVSNKVIYYLGGLLSSTRYSSIYFYIV